MMMTFVIVVLKISFCCSANSNEASRIPISELGKTIGKATNKSKKRAKKPNLGAVSSSNPKKSSRNAKRPKLEYEDDREDGRKRARSDRVHSQKPTM